MSESLISIIIPTYNRAYLISETLDSILTQTYINWECIVVDDGSTDNTAAILAKYIEQDNRFQYYKTANKGAANARNVGLSYANGEYIQYLDADDILHSEKFEKQLEFMLLNNLELSFTHWGYILEGIIQQQTFRFAKIDFSKFKKGQDVLLSFGMEDWFVLVHAWLAKRKLLDKAGYWNILISNNDDGEYFFRVLLQAKTVGVISEILAFYRVSLSDSLGKSNSESKINSAYYSYRIIEKSLQSRNLIELLAYPKRLYYIQYNCLKNEYPILAKRAARGFDSLKVNCFLSKRPKYWLLISWFGLWKGTIIYNKLLLLNTKI